MRKLFKLGFLPLIALLALGPAQAQIKPVTSNYTVNNIDCGNTIANTGNSTVTLNVAHPLFLPCTVWLNAGAGGFTINTVGSDTQTGAQSLPPGSTQLMAITSGGGGAYTIAVTPPGAGGGGGGSGTVTSVGLSSSNLTVTGSPITTTGTATVAIPVGGVTDALASLANKPTVGLVAVANLTLSGAQTIDGVLGVAGTTLVLATAQTTASQNGPWLMQSGAWTRPAWYPSAGTSQAFQFAAIRVRLGTVYADSLWDITSAGAVTIDTTSTTWTVKPLSLNASTVTSPITIATFNATSATTPYQFNGTAVDYFATDPGGGFSMFFGQGAGSTTSAANIAAMSKGFFTCAGYQACGGAGVGMSGAAVNVENTAFGWSAGSKWTTGVYDTAVGVGTMRNETTGGNNVAVGVDSMGNSIGANTSVGVGVGTLKYGAPQASVAIGHSALGSTLLTSANNNVAVGYGALSGVTTDTNVTAVGNLAGNLQAAANYNTLIGSRVGSAITSGAHNMILGANTSTGLTLTTGSNNVILGYNLDALAAGTNNEVNIGTPASGSVGPILGYGVLPTVSSGGGTSPSVSGNGTFVFKVTEGATGVPTTTLVMNMGNAPTDWVCTALDRTSASITSRQSGAASTTTATITFSGAPANADVIEFQCGAM